MSKTKENTARKNNQHGPDRFQKGEKAKDFSKTIKQLLSYLRPYKIKLVIILVFAILSTIFVIISPNILGNATDEIVKGMFSPSGINFDKLLEIIYLLIGLYGLSFVFNFTQSFIMSKVSQEVTYNMRKNVSEKIDRLPLKYFDSKTHGDLQSRVVNDIETINQTLSQSLTQMISSVVTIIGIVVMMIRISLPMTITAMIVLPLSMLCIKFIVGKSQSQFSAQQNSLAEVNGHIEEMFTGQVIIKAFNKEYKSKEQFNTINKKLYDSAWKSQFFSGLMMPIVMFIGNIGYVFVCILGGYLAIHGKVTIGNIQAFIQYVRNFNQPISQVANIANLLQSTAAAAERIFEFLAEEEEKDPFDTEVLHCMAKPKTNGKVTFNNVKFGYNENEIIINDFSFTANPGDTIAIVGPTGAGKTTLIKILLRYYELNGGNITIDDKDITDFNRCELREQFGMVLQDTWLFNGSIYDNIRYGKQSATKEEVIEAAKTANLHHHIQALPNGYDLVLNEETTNISQGQKQLLTIARAMLADNPIMILDEATSSVDTRTEKQIQSAMEELMKNRTSFVIAHRLSTIKDADTILVLNNGDIVEQGSHQELVDKKGFYEKLYNSQFEE